MSKHVAKDVFENTNIYKVYSLTDPKYKKDLKINFTLKESYQIKLINVVYVKMVYSVDITDSQDRMICGSRDIPITLTVKKNGNQLFIIHKFEPA